MCSTRCIKYLVVFFNFIFIVLGILLIGVGSWAEVKYGDFIEITSVDYASASRLVIGVGIIITIIAFFGFLGAVKENKCMLTTFVVFLLLLLILEITGAALGYAFSDKVKSQTQNDLLDGVQKKYGQPDQKGTTKYIDILQETKHCCGVQNYTNWFRSKYSQGNDSKLPDSCCRVKKPFCANPLKDVNDIYPKGCYEKLSDTVQDQLYLIGSVCVTLIVFQILGIIFAIVLIRAANKSESIA